MKNHQWLRKLGVKQLAKMLIHTKEINEGDEGMDGEWCDDYVMYYVCPDGTLAYDEEDAIQETIKWLNSEHIAGM